MSKNLDWVYVGHVAGHEPFFINGVNVWDYSWSFLEDTESHKISVKDERGNQFDFTVWYIEPFPHQKIVFAAGEYSNGIYGFYRPGKSSKD